MTYPAAPWINKGFAYQSLHLIDIERARAFVPKDLQIVSVLPGKTLGVFFTAAYGPGSALEYNELIVAPALTRHGGRFGFWISHIYVDNEDSMAGGREVWGLPKEMAQFSWSNTGVEVYQGKLQLAALRWREPRWLLPMLLFLPTFSKLGLNLLAFLGKVRARSGITSGQLDVPAESPFAALNLSGKKRVFPLLDMTFKAGAPRVVATEALKDPSLAQNT
jgi:acetoacetate decarboxylase